MKIKCFGSRAITAQIDRIEEGFRHLGHAVLSGEGGSLESPEIVYCNDIGCADAAWDYRKQRNGNTLLIQTVLDIPVHLQNLDKIIEDINKKARRADIVCSISKFVQGQLKDYLGLDSHVIYQPIKPVGYIRSSGREYKYLIVGRNRDPNKKHAEITLPAIWELENGFDNLYVVGEDIGYGNYLGNVTDEELDIIYHNSEYIFTPSEIEGLCLPRIEGAICGVKPICLSWDKVAREFFEPIIVGPSVKHVVDAIQSEEWNYAAECFVCDSKYMFSLQFNKISIARNILNTIK